MPLLTARRGQPSRDWVNPHLGYLKTSRARAKVRAWFKQQDLEKTLSAGREILDRELRRLGAGDVNLDKLARRLRFRGVDELMAALGRGEIGPTHIAGGVQEDLLPQAEPTAKPRSRGSPRSRRVRKSSRSSVPC